MSGKERIVHMESCLACGTTTSSAMERNDEIEAMAQKLIELAERARDHKALRDLAQDQVSRMSGFSTTGCCDYDGPSALRNLRRPRIAASATQALIRMLEPKANTENRFDSSGHKI